MVEVFVCVSGTIADRSWSVLSALSESLKDWYSLCKCTSHSQTPDNITAMTAMCMDVDGLDNPERAQLLSVVDEFRALGISKEISLPQVSHSHLPSLTSNDGR